MTVLMIQGLYTFHKKIFKAWRLQKTMRKESLRGWALLALRLWIGFIFVYHGYPKLTGGFGPFGLPGWVGIIVGIVEVVFGLASIIGGGFPWVTYPLMVVIGVAFLFMQIPNGITAGSERDLLIFICLVVLAAFGAGKLALAKKRSK